MVALCAATNTTLDDYYDWSVPELRRHVLNEKLDSVNGPYSKQFHGFVQSSLEDTDDRRASLEDHERFLRPYQNDINNLKLDFKQRKTLVASAIPIVVQEVRPDKYTGLVYGDDAFFRNPTPTEINRVIEPATVNPVVQLNYDDFFGQKTTIVENNRGDLFFR